MDRLLGTRIRVHMSRSHCCRISGPKGRVPGARFKVTNGKAYHPGVRVSMVRVLRVRIQIPRSRSSSLG